MKINYEQIVSKVEKAGIEYTLFRFDPCTYVEIGRYGYRFDAHGNSAGGWVRNCAEDWRSEWQEWMVLLTEHS